MKINIQARSFSLTNALRSHIQRRLSFTLTSSADYIQRVMVRLSDINGPRGGSDKRCHIHVVLRGLPNVVVEDTENDLYAAISRATGRASRAVARRLRRRQVTERRTGGLPTNTIMSAGGHNHALNES